MKLLTRHGLRLRRGSPDTFKRCVVLWHTSAAGGSPTTSWPVIPLQTGKPATRKGPGLPWQADTHTSHPYTIVGLTIASIRRLITGKDLSCVRTLYLAVKQAQVVSGFRPQVQCTSAIRSVAVQELICHCLQICPVLLLELPVLELGLAPDLHC